MFKQKETFMSKKEITNIRRVESVTLLLILSDMEFQPLLTATNLCFLFNSKNHQAFLKRFFDTLVTFAYLIVYVLASISAFQKLEVSFMVMMRMITAAIVALQIVNLRLFFVSNSFHISTLMARFNGRSIFNNREIILKELEMRKTTSKWTRGLSYGCLIIVIVFATAWIIVLCFMLKEGLLDDLAYWLPFSQAASRSSPKLSIYATIVIGSLGMTFGIATVISSNMLFSSFIYALAMRKKLLREIAPIAFKKFRHVPDFSVILMKWLSYHELNEKMVYEAVNLLSSTIYYNQFASIVRIYLFSSKLFLAPFLSPEQYLMILLIFINLSNMVTAAIAGQLLINEKKFLQVEVARLIKQRISEPGCDRKGDWIALAAEFNRSNDNTCLNGLGCASLMLESAVLASALLVAFIVKLYVFQAL